MQPSIKLRRPRLYQVLVCGFFILAVGVPAVQYFAQDYQKFSAMEKRALSPRPSRPSTSAELEQFPKRFAQYYADYFGYREPLIRLYRRIKSALGDSPAADVTIGKDGWLFLGSIKPGYSKYSDPIGDARHVNRYTSQQLQDAAERFADIAYWLKEQGVEYVLLITPNKHTVYAEKLPFYIEQENVESATDQLVEYLREHTSVNVVDLRATLIASKNEGQLYSKTDTHWNALGANIGQQVLMETLQGLFPGRVKPKRFEVIPATSSAKDLGIQVGRENVIEQDYMPVFDRDCEPVRYPKEGREKGPYTYVCEGQDLNVVVYQDSFFTALQPYFSRQIGRSTYLWDNSTFKSLRNTVVNKARDLVIEQLVERRLPYIPVENQGFRQSPNKQYFEASQTILFDNDFSRLRYNSNLAAREMVDGALEVSVSGDNPAIRFLRLPFRSDRKYVLRLQMTSSVDSNLVLRLSERNFDPKEPFAGYLSERLDIKAGDNDLYIRFSHPRIGPLIRLKPLERPGELSFHNVQIREIESRQ